MKFENIYIGQKESLKHKVTQLDIDKFVELTGDDNKLHVDEEFAARTSFKKPVVHGMIGASFISTIIGTKIPGDGALWFSQTLEFLLPVRIGDSLTVMAEVVKKHDRDRIIELNVKIENQNRQIVTKGVSKIKVLDEIVNVTNEPTQFSVERVALVVGATGGIGQAVCLQLAKDGYNVILHCHSNIVKAERIQKEIIAIGRKAIILHADVLNTDDIYALVEQAFRKMNRIDLYVNCAATSIPPIRLQELEWSDFIQQLDLNIKVNLIFIKMLLPKMLENKFGKIITIGTVYTDKPNVNLAHYTTAKAALEGFTKSLAFELSSKGIHVNMVSPSVIDTDLTSDIPEKVKLMTAAQTPLRRLAIPEDVAGAVSFLASNRANFLSGEIIRVNGGLIMR